jgi:excisionase family DNA binding protein
LDNVSVEQGNNEDPFLTVAEVAELLKLNQQTVRNWIDQGSLPAIRMGRRVRIKRSDFERVLEQNYSPGTVAPADSAGPSAEDFWGGTPVGLAEPDPTSPDAHGPPAGTTDAVPQALPDPDSRPEAGIPRP